MRRKYAEITDHDEITRILTETNIGRMATIGEQGYPYITPLNFVFLEGCVYFHCANSGEKLDNIQRDSKVCFEVDVPLAYLKVDFTPKKDPCSTHQYYHCVILRGNARIVPGGDLKTRALNALMEKHEGNRCFPPITPEQPQYIMCTVVEITPESTTGKADIAQNKTPADKHQIAEHLATRGLPGDLEAVRYMGYALKRNEAGAWQIKN